MKITCPECGATGNIDESKIPDVGRKVKCGRCNKVFMVGGEIAEMEIINEKESNKTHPLKRKNDIYFRVIVFIVLLFFIFLYVRPYLPERKININCIDRRGKLKWTQYGRQ
ncbi:MAG: zinc-ribbon domain-containing protein [Deltaproteobacteria bacterium]|uniref:Zinc-ribbon domain-containing protein n=1 Tax=Candidatus Zymogenus saltonus TaxID=2844893 RepID=A0A9D8PPM4_9DELT|nr:zinc-ribbon domain-containing protein [Candidatus Zymogenus saltonus]